MAKRGGTVSKVVTTSKTGEVTTTYYGKTKFGGSAPVKSVRPSSSVSDAEIIAAAEKAGQSIEDTAKSETGGVSIAKEVRAEREYISKQPGVFVDPRTGQGFSINPQIVQNKATEYQLFNTAYGKYLPPEKRSRDIAPIGKEDNRTDIIRPALLGFRGSIEEKQAQTKTTQQQLIAARSQIPFGTSRFGLNIGVQEAAVSRAGLEGLRTGTNFLTTLYDISPIGVREGRDFSQREPIFTSAFDNLYFKVPLAETGKGLAVFGGKLLSDVQTAQSSPTIFPELSYMFTEQLGGYAQYPERAVGDYAAFKLELGLAAPVTNRATNFFNTKLYPYLAEDYAGNKVFIDLKDVGFGGGKYKGVKVLDSFSDFSYGKGVNKNLVGLQGKNVAVTHVTSSPFLDPYSMEGVVKTTTPPIVEKSFSSPLGKFTLRETPGDLGVGAVNLRRARMQEGNFYVAPEKGAPLLSDRYFKNIFVDGEINPRLKITEVLQPGSAQAYGKYLTGDSSYGYKFSTVNRPTIYYGEAEVGKLPVKPGETELQYSLRLVKEGVPGKLYVSPENIFGASRERQLVFLPGTKLDLAGDVAFNPKVSSTELSIFGQDFSKALSKTNPSVSLESAGIPRATYKSIYTYKNENPFTATKATVPRLLRPVYSGGEKIFETIAPKTRTMRVDLVNVKFSRENAPQTKDLVGSSRDIVKYSEGKPTIPEIEFKSSRAKIVSSSELVKPVSRLFSSSRSRVSSSYSYRPSSRPFSSYSPYSSSSFSKVSSSKPISSSEISSSRPISSVSSTYRPSSSSYLYSSSSISSVSTPITTTKPPKIFNLKFRSPETKRVERPSRKSTFKFGYTPSLEAGFFGIKGRPSRFARVSGLAVRPLVR